VIDISRYPELEIAKGRLLRARKRANRCAAADGRSATSTR